MKRIIFFIILFTLFFSCSVDESLEELLVQAIDYRGFSDKKWTIMFYMCADNNLNLASVDDINEMISINVPIWCPDENINIVVLWDQTASYSGGDRHGYYLIKYSGAKLLHDTGEIDMGDPEVVKAFIDFTTDRYEADSYMFVFWDHGGGVDKSVILSDANIQKSIGLDITDGGSGLSDSEQVEILQHLYGKTGKKIDLLIYDACLMGMAELMHQAKNYANYFIGSEDNVPSSGLDYGFIGEIYNDPSVSASKVARKAVGYYASYYASSAQVTMSAINLSKMENLSLNLALFASYAENGGDSYKNYFYYSTIYDDINFYPSSDPSSYGFADLYYYMINVKEKLTDAGYSSHPAITPANNIINLINNGGIIVSEYHGAYHTGRTKGISILMANTGSLYSVNAFNAATNWANFLDWLDIP